MKTLYHNGKIISKGNVFTGMVLVNDGIVENILPSSFALPAADEVIDLQGNYLSAGFVDTHIHGSGGFGTDRDNPQDLLDMSDVLLKQGVAAFTPTIYPAQTEKMIETVAKLAPAIGKEKGARIAGFHLEGPFISPAKPGVMKPQDIAPINVEVADKLYKAAGGKIAAMTVAPELKGIAELAAYAKEKKFILQSGHTDATYEQMKAAAELGITHVTHLFNAMRAMSHREPGAAGAALNEDIFSVEVIADGRHISPVIMNMVLKLKKPSKVILVTDSLNPTGKSEGLANGEEVYLSEGLFKRKQDNVIAGSSLTMLGGVKNLISWGFGIGNAFMAGCDNPAALHKLSCGSLEKGKRADLIVLDADFNLKQAIPAQKW